MKIENLFRNLRVLWRADSIIAQMRLQQMLAGLGFKALAALIAAFGLLMLELAAYFALVVTWSAVASALLLGTLNFMIALTIVLIAARRTPSRDLELALDLHKSSVDALQSDAVAIQSDLALLRTALSHPFDPSLAALAVPAVSLLIKALKKYREPPAAA